MVESGGPPGNQDHGADCGSDNRHDGGDLSGGLDDGRGGIPVGGDVEPANERHGITGSGIEKIQTAPTE